MTQPASGWYPDPSGQPGERWWNGSSWSQETRTAPVAPAPVPTGAPPQAWDGFGQPVAPGSTPPPYDGTPNLSNPPAYGGTPGYGGMPGYGGNSGYGGAPGYGGQPVGSTPPPYAGGPGQPYGAPNPGGRGLAGGAFFAGNGYSLATVGVAAAYVLALVFAHIAVLGILPLVLGASAVRRHEPLRWVALAIGVLALIFGIYLYAR